MKHEGRKAKYEKQLIDGNYKEKHLQKVWKLTRISSGELIATNLFLLDEIVLLLVQEKTFVEEENRNKLVIVNKIETMMHKQNTLQSSKKIQARQQLLSSDLKVLIQQYKTKGNSPMKKCDAEIQEQWVRRKFRMVFLQLVSFRTRNQQKRKS